jgi:hypothetical protein
VHHPRQMALLSAVLLLASITPAPAEELGGQPPDPGPPVRPGDVEELRRQILEETQSSLELLLDVHDETGDRNSELDFVRYGARLNLRVRPATTLFLSAQRTPYRTQDGAFQSTATGVTAGLRVRVSPRREWEGELSATRFGAGNWSVTGMAGVTFRPNDALRYSLSLQRTNVEESLLSVAGLRPVEGPFAGMLVGGVTDNRLVASGSCRLPRRFDLYGEAGLGVRVGSNVDHDFFRRASAGLGYVAVARAEEESLSLLRLSVAVDYFGFDEDRLGYGGASLLDARYQPVPPAALGSDGISPFPSEGNPGVGGYFSPQLFISRGLRVEARGRPGPRIQYSASVFLGQQSFTGVSTRTAASLALGLRARLGGRLSLPVTYTWDDFGPFRQQSLAARLVMGF